jgi:hypothetical protein
MHGSANGRADTKLTWRGGNPNRPAGRVVGLGIVRGSTDRKSAMRLTSAWARPSRAGITATQTIHEKCIFRLFSHCCLDFRALGADRTATARTCC